MPRALKAYRARARPVPSSRPSPPTPAGLPAVRAPSARPARRKALHSPHRARPGSRRPRRPRSIREAIAARQATDHPAAAAPIRQLIRRQAKPASRQHRRSRKRHRPNNDLVWQSRVPECREMPLSQVRRRKVRPRLWRPPSAGCHWPLMPAFLITSPHFFISPAMN